MDIDKLLADYLRGELSDDDRKTIEQWLDEDPEHKTHLDSLAEVWKLPLQYTPLPNTDSERQQLWSRLNPENKDELPAVRRHSFTKTVMKYAAALVLASSLVTALYTFRTATHVPQVVTLTERTNPLGQKSRIQLPDGSRVWLNAGSSLSYSSDFGSVNRRLQLEGEAFFEVKKDTRLPFEVVTDRMVVTALGTSFNVNAFHNSKKVALRTGKVKVQCLGTPEPSCSEIYLNPGEMASLNGDFEITKFHHSDPFDWKDGRLTFHHASYNEVIDVLGRWYNVRIETTGKLDKEWDYSGTFENEVLENVLESLAFSEKINYEIHGSQVEINL